MMERGRKRRVYVGGEETDGDQQAAAQQHDEVPARHLRTEYVVAFAGHRRIDPAVAMAKIRIVSIIGLLK